MKWQLFWEEGNSPGSQKAYENAAYVLPGEISLAVSTQPFRQFSGLKSNLKLTCASMHKSLKTWIQGLDPDLWEMPAQ